MSVKLTNKNGKDVVLLTPSEKGKKYAIELRHGKRLTNMGVRKRGEDGKQLTLSKEARAFRSGYLQARKDITKCRKAVEGKV